MVYGRDIVNFLVVDGKHSIDLLLDQTDQSDRWLVAVRADKQRENLEAIVLIHQWAVLIYYTVVGTNLVIPFYQAIVIRKGILIAIMRVVIDSEI